MPERQRCATCLYFQDADLAGSGWCRHPLRQESSNNLILVRKSELACRDQWTQSLWTPTALGSSASPVTTPLSEKPQQSGTEIRVRPLMLADTRTAPLLPKSSSSRQLRVFLCHASGDKPAVRDLYRVLRARGVEPWFDEEDLLPGQRWEEEIPRAVRRSDVVVVCLSQASVNKAGYVQKEIVLALDAADLQPEGAIFLIPVRLEACDVPDRLRRYQWGDLYTANGLERLLTALRVRALAVGAIVPSRWSGN